ncbi:MAG TPA: hypothetical protein ENH32_07805 [Proteobacteria bacterium]|nr:hypothetical protein [Pseudomonadota bacterium]
MKKPSICMGHCNGRGELVMSRLIAIALLSLLLGTAPVAGAASALGAGDNQPSAGSVSGKTYVGMTISHDAPGGNHYLGAKACAGCHEDEYAGWKETFHSTVVQDARANPSAILADFTLEDLPFTRDEVEYTIGLHWDQRYMKKIGKEYYVLPRLWAVQSKEWRPYSVWSWKRKPYSKYCAGCHTTHYNPEKRTIADEGVSCEECHGPGELHVAGGGDPKEIINPSKLDKARGNMICASCHVRGTDKSGKYYFPVGFMPGEDLADYYIPLEMKEGESVDDAISRIYGEWENKMTNSSRAKCEVCGITGQKTDGKKDPDTMDFCFSCHDFRAKMPLHTRHPNTVKLVCNDCHVKRGKDLNKGLSGNIHSYSYFLVHTQNCYDPRIQKACAKCHTDKPDAENWALDLINSWKKPVFVGH